MRVFLSAGEPSGDLHGSNLIHALRAADPSLEFIGFGGERMERAGCALLYPLCRLAVMWFLRVLTNARTFLRLLREADRYFRDQKPDVLVLIDYPGFNFQLARLAQARGIPVIWFVPPQLWAWAGWRVRKVSRWVDQLLCSLPFEPAWYQARGVSTAKYVGHPYFDELTTRPLDEPFIEQQRRPGRPVVGLLPGSRDQEIARNLPMMLDAAARVQAVRPDVRFLVACLHPHQADHVQALVDQRTGLRVEVHSGRTAEIIHLAHSTIAVSGSVGLELLYHGKPSVVVYRLGRLHLWLARRFAKVRFISLVNLLADREVFPEFATARNEAEGIAAHVLRWLNDPAALAAVSRELGHLRAHVAEAGACDRAAAEILQTMQHIREQRRVA